ncbi:hypothetical protein IMZ48_48680, partial [Candidatus Bathyarchaeota archaeon]|nr:hypothetical protein [Candidatus Bathyarchaeota archaeon]
MHATQLAALGAFLATAAAHGIVDSIVVDGEWTKNFQTSYIGMDDPPVVPGWTTNNPDLGFVSTGDWETPDIICHRDAVPSTISATVAAGGSIGFKWNQWADSHMGPIMTYVAKVTGDFGDVKKEELEWVKIEEFGYNKAKDNWAANDLTHAPNTTWTTNV